MTNRERAKQYVEFLENNEIDNIIQLFSKSGQVSSPLYGKRLAKDFYKELSEDSVNSKLNLKGVFEDKEDHRIAIFFNYKWTLKNKKIIEFDVVDIIEFNKDNKIENLQIIYDTVQSRALIKELKSNKI